MKSKPKTLTVTEFKARCLRILDELDSQGIIVTRRGRPVAKVLPLRSANNADLIGGMRGKVKIKADILSTGIKWNAEVGKW